MFDVILAPIKLEAEIIVKGLVIATENPKPVEREHTKNPVKLSKPKLMQMEITIGRRINVSSNKPNNEPKSIKNSSIIAIKRSLLPLSLKIIPFTICSIPLQSDITSNVPAIMLKKIISIIG